MGKFNWKLMNTILKHMKQHVVCTLSNYFQICRYSKVISVQFDIRLVKTAATVVLLIFVLKSNI